MRILFLLLLLLNLGYFGWQWQQQQDVTAVQASGAIPVEPGAKTLVLLNEPGAAAGAASTGTRSDGLQETTPANP